MMNTATLVTSVRDPRSGEVHLPSEEVAEVQEWLAVSLAMIAGFLDAYGTITYNTYLSFMSGNTTQTGYRSDKAILEQQCLRRWRSFSRNLWTGVDSG